MQTPWHDRCGKWNISAQATGAGMPQTSEHRRNENVRSPNIAANIRQLVSQYPSISAAAQDLGINRQQLNEYLNGSTVPSLRVMRKFARTFNLPTDAIVKAPERCEPRSRRNATGSRRAKVRSSTTCGMSSRIRMPRSGIIAADTCGIPETRSFPDRSSVPLPPYPRGGA